jgi:hypothetical protein
MAYLAKTSVAEIIWHRLVGRLANGLLERIGERSDVGLFHGTIPAFVRRPEEKYEPQDAHFPFEKERSISRIEIRRIIAFTYLLFVTYNKIQSGPKVS